MISLADELVVRIHTANCVLEGHIVWRNSEAHTSTLYLSFSGFEKVLGCIYSTGVKNP